MKKVLIFILALLCLAACGKSETPPEGAVARVGEEYIYTETVESDRALGITGTDREITEGKVLNMLMVLEAESMGLSATEDEIAEFMAGQEQAWQMAGVEEQLKAMYEPLGIGFEEYKAMVGEGAPGVIARQKLQDSYGQEYCEKHGIEFTKVNPPAEMEAYVETQLDELMDKYK